jgi:hypothetical protein
MVFGLSGVVLTDWRGRALLSCLAYAGAGYAGLWPDDGYCPGAHGLFNVGLLGLHPPGTPMRPGTRCVCWWGREGL